MIASKSPGPLSAMISRLRAQIVVASAGAASCPSIVTPFDRALLYLI